MIYLRKVTADGCQLVADMNPEQQACLRSGDRMRAAIKAYQEGQIALCTAMKEEVIAERGAEAGELFRLEVVRCAKHKAFQ